MTEAAPPAASASGRGSRLAHAALLALLVGTVYANTLRNGFVWDDNDIIVNNRANESLGSIPALFSQADVSATGLHHAYYRPLARLTYVIDHRLFGKRPAWYHAENLFLHALAAIALYSVVRRWFGRPDLALVASSLFAVHPVNVEAVAFLATRNTLLAALFACLALAVHGAWRAGGGGWMRAASWLLMLAGLLSKETAAMAIPFLLVDDAPTPRGPAPTLRERLRPLGPFAIVVAGYLLLRANALSGIVGADLEPAGLAERLARNAYIVPKYFALAAFPAGLNAVHEVPAFLALPLVPGWLLVGAIAGLALRVGTRASRLGLIWFAVHLLPVCGIVPLPSAPLAERYLYLPAAGLWIVAADLACRAWERVAWRRYVAVAGIAAMCALAATSARRNSVWRDATTFYTELARANPGSAMAHYSLGLAAIERGDRRGVLGPWERAATIDPAYFDVAAKLGEAHLREGNLVEAERWLEAAAGVGSPAPASLFNLAVLEDRSGKPGEAVVHYEAFLRAATPEMGGAIGRAQARIAAIRAGAPSTPP